MKEQTRPPLWIILGMLLVWAGFIANVAYDYIHDHRITPFSILIFIALLAGYLLPRIFKWPVYTNRPSRSAIISILILFGFVIVYSLVRIFLTNG